MGMVAAGGQVVLCLLGANNGRKAHISVKHAVFSEVILSCDRQSQVALDKKVRRLGRSSSGLKAQEIFLCEK